MKKCEQFKELILTDYIDGELNKDSAGHVESHLLDCSDCRAFFKEVRSLGTISPVSCSANVLSQPVPAELWDSIKQGIEQENQASSPFADVIEKLKGLMALPKMVPIFASFILMFLAGSVTLNTIQVQRLQAREQGEYLVSLLSPTGASSPADSNDSGTPIEHYFL